MTYYCGEKPCTSYQDSFDFICAALVGMGWGLYDEISSTEKVYRSNGENGDRPYGYIYLKFSSTCVNTKTYLYWDNTTHAGSCCAYYNSSYYKFYFSSSYDLYIAGNKNLVFINCGDVNSYNNDYAIVFGHIPGICDEVLTTLTSGIIAGDNVSIPVSDSSNFIAGNSYWLVGASGEGRDWGIVVNSIPDPTHIIVQNIPRDYGSGSFIGTYPCTFGATTYENNRNYFFPVCHRNVSGIDNVTSSSYYFLLTCFSNSTAYSNPSDFNNKHCLYPLDILEQTSLNNSRIALIDNIYMATDVAYDSRSIFGISSTLTIPINTATGATSTTLQDTSQSWTTNELQDKIIVIVDGTGVGYSRRIISNTEDTITIGRDWIINPVAGSNYQIYDEVYRHYYYGFCSKEIVG